MAVRKILTGNDPILKKKCKTVPEVDDKARQQLDDLMDTLHSAENGAALAANQAGILRRMIVIDHEGYYLKLVNPVIVESSGSQECVEGCLSFPNRFGKTIRPAKVTVEALDEHGHEVSYTVVGEMAKCFCHEIDHLDGEVFIDKVYEYVGIDE